MKKQRSGDVHRIHHVCVYPQEKMSCKIIILGTQRANAIPRVLAGLDYNTPSVLTASMIKLDGEAAANLRQQIYDSKSSAERQMVDA